MRKFPLPGRFGVPLAIAIVALALGLQLLLKPYVGTILFIGMYPVIFLSAWIGGTRAGLISLVLTLLTVDYYFIGNPGSLFMYSLADIIRLSFFTLTNLIFIGILNRMRKTERALAESELLYRTMVELSPHFIWFTDARGENTFINKTMSEYTGLKLEDTLSQGWRKFIHPADADRIFQAWKESLENLRSHEIEMRIRRTDGEYRWFLTRSMPVINEQGQVERWIGTSVDFHEQKMSLLTRDVFFSFASHELKTPLTSLKLKIQVMERKLKDKDAGATDPATIKSFIDTARNKVDVFQGIIDEMLDVSRITSGKMTYFFEKQNLSDILTRAVDNVSIQYQEAGVPLKANIKESAFVSGDQTKLIQVFVNLLTNAFKYGNRKPVSISLTKEGPKLRVEVVDQGIGIAPENQDRIFSCFERIDEQSVSGLGVGLFISRQIVEDHRGHLLLTSKPGEGSTFTVELPIEP